MNRVEILESNEKPEGLTQTDELAWALSRVLRWTNPQGTIADAYVPGWLTQHAKDALLRYVHEA
jgi:hypothetical protein